MPTSTPLETRLQHMEDQLKAHEARLTGHDLAGLERDRTQAQILASNCRIEQVLAQILAIITPSAKR